MDIQLLNVYATMTIHSFEDKIEGFESALSKRGVVSVPRLIEVVSSRVCAYTSEQHRWYVAVELRATNENMQKHMLHS